MPQRRPRLVLPALLVLGLSGCQGDGGSASGPAVAHFEMRDFQAPAMFEQLAAGLRKAYVLELPSRPVNERFDLEIEDTSETGVLAALVKLDPSFQYERREDVLLFYPAGDEGRQSSFSRTVASFRADGGAGAAIRDLVTAAGLAASTEVQIDAAGDKRPVKIDAHSATVRSILGDVAAQAHLGMKNEPGSVRAFAVPE